MERRALAGTTVETSVLGLDLSRESPPTDRENRIDMAVVQVAARSEVGTFALGPPGGLDRTIALVRSVLPSSPGKYLFVVDWPGGSPRYSGPPARPAVPSDRASGPDLTFENLRGLRQLGEVIVDWDPAQGSADRVQTRRWLSGLRDGGTITAWCERRNFSRPEELAAGLGSPRALSSVSLSVLDRDRLGTVESLLGDRAASVLVRDPFSHGRLDGTRFSTTLGERGPRTAPPDLRALHAEFDPVVQLAPLTADRRRTLAQAALQYLVSRRWVATVLVPVSSAERWAEYEGALTAPPIPSGALRSLGLDRERGALPSSVPRPPD